VATYELVSALPLEVESYALERLEQPVSSAFTRVTTVIRLRGSGEEGIGEDVTYLPEEQDAFQAGPLLPLSGRHTLDSFSQLVDDQPDYRRWGFESAALDLALRQGRRSLAEVLGREPQPVQFVVSMRLGDPTPSITPLRAWLDLYPNLRFKLDPTSAWDEQLFEQVAATGAVDSVDLKGAYKGTPVDQPADPVLYTRVVETFPDAWIEDPALTPETEAILAPHRDRITWDAPIHSVADIEALPFPPRTINIKPSRFGSVRRLFDTYDYCEQRRIAPYGGGQFELGPGRGQIQYLASLFHAEAPNDVAPGGFNLAPRPGLPESPLAAAPASTGFRWGDWP
jgi:hypothetical protein